MTVVTASRSHAPLRRRSRFLWVFLFILGAIAWTHVPVHAQSVVPAGFQVEQVVGSDLVSAATMAIAPDGRIFITEKTRGTIRVVKNDILLPQPFVDLAVNFCGERGALGVCLDPDFASNNWVYLFYTLSSTGSDTSDASSVIDNRIVRFTASGDTALAGSETLIRSLPIFSNCNHNSGNIHFGFDDTLLVTYGDGNTFPIASLDLFDLHGKMLRLDATTGQAAPGNLFASDGDPLTLPEIWAYGLRNSFDFTLHPVTGKIFATENGPATDDEVNVIEEGLQFGWPIVSGFADTPAESTFAANNSNYRDPVWSTADSVVCPTGIVVVPGGPWEAILGKSLLVGQCLAFADGRRIIRLPLGGAQGDSVDGPEEIFAIDFPTLITDIEFDSEDRLYVLNRSRLWRISPDGTVAAPPATDRPGSVLSHHGPHPSLSAASVRYQLSGDGPAELSIVDARGRRVRVLEAGIVGPGSFVARWDGNDDSGRRVSSGVYYYRLVEGGRVRSLSVVRIR